MPEGLAEEAKAERVHKGGALISLPTSEHQKAGYISVKISVKIFKKPVLPYNIFEVD